MSADVPRNGRLPFTRCAPGDLAETVLIPGDPGRLDVFALGLDEVTGRIDSATYPSCTGVRDGVAVSCLAAGIGCPPTALAVEELARLGVRTVIRIGTCGSLQPWLEPGVLVIATGAVRGDGTSQQYLPPEYPAIADFTVVQALTDACESVGARYATGVVRSHDAFYLESPWADDGARARLDPWIDLGVLALENETSALFSVASLRHLRAGSILAAGYPIFERPPRFSHGEDEKRAMVEVAMIAALRLAGIDDPSPDTTVCVG